MLPYPNGVGDRVVEAPRHVSLVSEAGVGPPSPYLLLLHARPCPRHQTYEIGGRRVLSTHLAYLVSWSEMAYTRCQSFLAGHTWTTPGLGP